MELVTLCGSKDCFELFIYSFGGPRHIQCPHISVTTLSVRQPRMLACTMRPCWELLPCCGGRWRRRSRRCSGRPRRPRPRSLRRFGSGPVRSSPRPTPTLPSRTLQGTHTHAAGKIHRHRRGNENQRGGTSFDQSIELKHGKISQFKITMLLSWFDSHFFLRLLLRKGDQRHRWWHKIMTERKEGGEID